MQVVPERQAHRLNCNVQRPSVRMLHFVFRTARSSARRSTHLDVTQADLSSRSLGLAALALSRASYGMQHAVLDAPMRQRPG